MLTCVTCIQVNVLEPHPHLPLLATSGLDSDVKLWMSTASEPANMSTLQRASGATCTHHFLSFLRLETRVLRHLETIFTPILGLGSCYLVSYE